MKKVHKLTQLALIGLTAGLTGSCQTKADQVKFSNDEKDPVLTEEELLTQLTDKTIIVYQNLPKEAKSLARKLASQTCSGKNDCKGLNSCKSVTNDCAGKGGCKGTALGPFTDKNLAVQVAAMKMSKKRESLENKQGNTNQEMTPGAKISWNYAWENKTGKSI